MTRGRTPITVAYAQQLLAWRAADPLTRGDAPLREPNRARGESPRIFHREMTRDTDERLKAALRMAR